MRFSEREFDEALWAAYRRHDKVAVTEKLLGRFAAGLSESRLPVRLQPRARFANTGRRARANSRHPERYTDHSTRFRPRVRTELKHPISLHNSAPGQLCGRDRPAALKK